jgi:hypothetical protein
LITLPISVFAHPGRTAADGCHYCRTNCDYWGVPWNKRHCHNGVIIDPTPSPTRTPIPSFSLTDLIKNEVNNTKTEYYKNSNWFREKLIDKLVGSLKASISSVAFYVYTMLPDVK